MDFTEEMLSKAVLSTNDSLKITYGDHDIDFTTPWPRLTMYEAIHKYTGVDISEMDLETLRAKANEMGVPVDETMGKGKIIDDMFGELVEHQLINPTFITDYPIEMSPLAKKHREKEGLVERFELIANGMELANCYTELNDPIDQRERFEDQLKLSEKGDDEAMFIDHDFLRALEYGMPPTSGIGIGIDRLTMFMTNNPSIQEVLFFPQMKPEKKAIAMTDEEKAIFSILKENTPIDLGKLKSQAGLSNKKWDKAMKGLAKHGLTQVTKTDEGLLVALKD